jgi:hypothetical protein
MSFKPFHLCLISAVISATQFVGSAHSADLTSLLSACNDNPSCSHEVTNSGGGVLFKIRIQDSTQNIFCTQDGDCLAVMPRGKKRRITDVAEIIMAH